MPSTPCRSRACGEVYGIACAVELELLLHFCRYLQPQRDAPGSLPPHFRSLWACWNDRAQPVPQQLPHVPDRVTRSCTESACHLCQAKLLSDINLKVLIGAAPSLWDFDMHLIRWHKGKCSETRVTTGICIFLRHEFILFGPSSHTFIFFALSISYFPGNSMDFIINKSHVGEISWCSKDI